MKKRYYLMLSFLAMLGTTANAQWEPCPNQHIPAFTQRVVHEMVADGNTILGGCWGYMVKSTDNGNNWEVVSHPALVSNLSQYANLVRVGSRVYAGARGNGGREIYYSDDLGLSWIIDTVGMPEMNFGPVVVKPAPVELVNLNNEYIFAQLESNFVLYKKTDEVSWSVLPVPSAYKTPGDVFAIGSRLFLVTDKLIYSDDLGQTWVTPANDIPQTGTGYISNVFVDGWGFIYAAYKNFTTQVETIIVTKDMGEHWDTLNFGFNTRAVRNIFVDQTEIFVALTPGGSDTTMRIMYSPNAGKTWSDVSLDINRYFSFGHLGITSFLKNNGVLFAGTDEIGVMRQNGITGIAPASARALTVYPNPAAQKIRIGKPFHVVSDVQICDLQGRVVKRLVLQAAEEEIALDGLPAGMYLVRLMNEEGVYQAKILKD